MNPLSKIIGIGSLIVIGSLSLTIWFQHRQIIRLQEYKAEVEARTQIAIQENIKLEEKYKHEIWKATTNYEDRIRDLIATHANELRLATARRPALPKFATNPRGADPTTEYQSCAGWCNGLLEKVSGFTGITDQLHDNCSELSFQARKQQAQLESLSEICSKLK